MSGARSKCARCGEALEAGADQPFHKCDLGLKSILLVYADGREETREIDALAAEACMSVTTHERIERTATADELLRTYPAEVLRDRYNPKYRHLFPKPAIRELQFLRAGERAGVPVFRQV